MVTQARDDGPARPPPPLAPERRWKRPECPGDPHRGERLPQVAGVADRVKLAAKEGGEDSVSLRGANVREDQL